MAWEELFNRHKSVNSSSRVDNNYDIFDKRYRSGWSATSSWTSKIPGFSGFRSFAKNDTTSYDALNDALPVLCNSISLFDSNAKIQWAFNGTNNNPNNTLLQKYLKFNSDSNRVNETILFLNPELVFESVTSSTALTQCYDALIGDAIMGGSYMKRMNDLPNVKEFACVYAVLSGRNLQSNAMDHKSNLYVDTQSFQTNYSNFERLIDVVFSKTSLTVAYKDHKSNIVRHDGSVDARKKLKFSYDFTKDFGSKFGKQMSIKFNETLGRAAIHLFSACEQRNAEISICEKYKGASSYIFASHKVSSPEKFRSVLRKYLAKCKTEYAPSFLVSVIVDAIVWNLINQHDQIFGNKFTKVIIQSVMSNLLPSIDDLPDVSLAKCVYIVSLIQNAVSGNKDVFDDNYGDQQGNFQDEDSSESDSGESGDSESDESESGDESDSESGDESGDSEAGNEAGDFSDISKDLGNMLGALLDESENGELTDSNGESQNSEDQGEAVVVEEALKPSYSRDDSVSSDNWKNNIRKYKLPLTALDALNDLEKNKDDSKELGGNKFLEYSKNRTHIGVSPTLSAFVNKKSKMSASGYIATESPIAVNDSRAIKAIQYTDADRMKPTRFFTNPQKSMEGYNKISKNHRTYIEMIRERLRVRSLGVKGEEYSKYDGMLDEGNIWQLYDKNNEQIFMHESQPKTVDKAHISLLIDASGSMEGNRIEMARDLGVILSSALNGVHGVEFKMYGHTNNNMFDFNNGMNKIEDVSTMPAGGGTAEGEAIQYVLRESDRHRVANEREGERTNYYLFVIGDGASQVDQIRKAMNLANESGIKVCHLGIDGAYDAKYGDATYGNGRYAILPSDAVIATMVTAITRILTL